MGYEAKFKVTEIKNCNPGDLILISLPRFNALGFLQSIGELQANVLIIGSLTDNGSIQKVENSFHLKGRNLESKAVSFGNNWHIDIDWTKIIHNRKIEYGAITMLNDDVRIIAMSESEYQLLIDLNDFKDHEPDASAFYTSINWSLYHTDGDNKKLIFEYRQE